MNRERCRKGFTLVEVIVVLVILAVLAAVLVPTYIGYIKKTEKTRCAIQRGDLEQKFIAMYNYDPKIRSCTTTAAVVHITGTNVAKYMLDNGYYEGEIKCPVYDQDYEFRLVPSGAGYRGEFTCKCVEDEFSKFEAIVKQEMEALGNKTWADGTLIDNVYNKYGSLPKVSDADLQKAGLSGTMYWRPYMLGNGTVIYFASSIAYESNHHGQWQANIVKIDGVIYSAESGKRISISEAKYYKNGQKDGVKGFINEFLKDNEFKERK